MQNIQVLCSILEHLHVLTQEALDHADLTVLTGNSVVAINMYNIAKMYYLGTIGAAALLRNCLRFYIQILSEEKSPSIESLRTGKHTGILTCSSFNSFRHLSIAGFKNYNEMCEALAERLLDLHCRLLSLYIIQDADCLDWENEKPFFESERGSYIIQMWWLYMQGKNRIS